MHLIGQLPVNQTTGEGWIEAYWIGGIVHGSKRSLWLVAQLCKPVSNKKSKSYENEQTTKSTTNYKVFMVTISAVLASIFEYRIKTTAGMESYFLLHRHRTHMLVGCSFCGVFKWNFLDLNNNIKNLCNLIATPWLLPQTALYLPLKQPLKTLSQLNTNSLATKQNTLVVGMLKSTRIIQISNALAIEKSISVNHKFYFRHTR